MKACFTGTRTKPITLKVIEAIQIAKDCELSITEEAMRQTDPVIGLEFIKQCALLNIKIKIEKSPDEKLKEQGVEFSMEKRSPKEIMEIFKDAFEGLDPTILASFADKMVDFVEGAEAREDDDI